MLKGNTLVEKIKNKKKLDAIFILAVIGVGLYLDFNIFEILIFAIFIYIILNPVPVKFLSIPALIFLVCAPLLYIFEQKELGEEFAVYAYFFLIMAVMMEIYAIRSEEKKARIRD